MRHSYYELLISRDKDNDLQNDEKIELEKHLKVCEKCRSFKNEIGSLSSVLNLKLKINDASKIKLNLYENIKKNFNSLKKIKNKKIINFYNIKNVIIVSAAVLLFALSFTVFIKNKHLSNNTANTVAVKDKNIDASNNEILQKTYDASMPLGEYLAYTIDEENNTKEPLVENEELPMYSYFAYFSGE